VTQKVRGREQYIVGFAHDNLQHGVSPELQMWKHAKTHRPLHIILVSTALELVQARTLDGDDERRSAVHGVSDRAARDLRDEDPEMRVLSRPSLEDEARRVVEVVRAERGALLLRERLEIRERVDNLGRAREAHEAHGRELLVRKRERLLRVALELRLQKRVSDASDTRKTRKNT
jgi:hypothetical protein